MEIFPRKHKLYEQYSKHRAVQNEGNKSYKSMKKNSTSIMLKLFLNNVEKIWKEIMCPVGWK